ncbi:hypothetical protein TNCV_3950721 [Trichonephila clavipes]|nr:hypothetical protein TNCV_3950721 [Trichonephila clavipes]
MGRTILLERRQSESVGRRNSHTTFLRSDWPRPFARREVGVEMDWVGKTGRKKKGRRTRKREENSSKRQGLVVLGSGEENPRVLFCDADQESKTRMRNNALRTGPRQAVE